MSWSSPVIFGKLDRLFNTEKFRRRCVPSFNETVMRWNLEHDIVRPNKKRYFKRAEQSSNLNPRTSQPPPVAWRQPLCWSETPVSEDWCLAPMSHVPAGLQGQPMIEIAETDRCLSVKHTADNNDTPTDLSIIILTTWNDSAGMCSTRFMSPIRYANSGLSRGL